MVSKNIIAVLLVSLLFTSCGDDTCTQSDWIGSYVGTEACGDETLAATIVITESGSDLSITVNNGTSIVEIPTVTPDNCSISGTFSDQGITLDLDGTLDGDDLSISTVFFGVTCNYTLTRI